MTHHDRRRHLNQLAILFVVVNLALLVAAHYFPSLFGGNAPGELDHTRLTGLVKILNYPIFWFFLKVTPKNWSATLLDVALLTACLILYWYCEGLAISALMRRLQKGKGNGDRA